MKIAEGVEMLELVAERPGGNGNMLIHPTLIWDQENAILVDAGFPGQLPKIRDAMEQAGVPFNRLTQIIITHHDLDHIGGLATIQRELPVETLSSAVEKDYINGTKTPLKMAQVNSLSEEARANFVRMSQAFRDNPAKVDRTLKDGEKLPCCGGITVIYTPGHTLGHISLYLHASKTLVSGDELRVENGVLELSPARINYDTQECIQSLKKIMQYDIDQVICYHGGLFNDHPNQRIAELAQTQPQ